MSLDAERIKALLAMGLARPAGPERAAWLEQACSSDEDLRAHLESILALIDAAPSHDSSPSLSPPSDDRSDSPGSSTNAGNKLGWALAAAGSAPAPTASVAEDSGVIIGHYKLLQRLGEGGMGTVWMAEQFDPVRRKVALKVIKPGMDSTNVLARFEAERQALALMDHPYIAKVFDAGTTESGRPYFVMELVKGVPITRYCDEQRLTIRQRLDLFLPVCQAIQHAHQKGIIHRDIKPSNVLVALYDGRPVPKVIDFGVAKAMGQQLTDKTLFTEFGAVIGTLEYMSPEQAELNQLDIDTRSDIYSLGVLLYQLLTGTTPLQRETMRQAALDEVLRTIREQEPPRPSTRLSQSGEALTGISAQRQLDPAALAREVRGDLDWIVMKALEKNRNQRYETANGLARDIQRHLNDEPVVARPPTPAYRLRKFIRKHRGPVVATSCFALLLMAASAISTGLALWANRERGRATKAETVATASAKESRSHLERLYVASGNNLVDEGKLMESLVWFAEAAPLVEGDPRRKEMHRIRFNSILRQCPRVSHVFTHGDLVRWCEFSPDGKWLATAGSDKIARVWDIGTGQPVSPPLKHEGIVVRIEFSPDGSKVATASIDGMVFLWDIATGTPAFPPLQHSNVVRAVSFSPNGKRILTGSDDGTARIWDTRTGDEVIGPLRHEGAVYNASFSSDGERILTSSSNVVRIWRARTGQPLLAPLQTRRQIWIALFSPNGERVLGGSGDGAFIWEASTGKKLFTLRVANGVDSARFSPDGRRIVTGNGDGAKVWDALAGTQIGTNMPCQAQRDVLFSPDSSRVVTCGDDGSVRLWDAESSQSVAPALRHAGWVFHAAFSPDGLWLGTASSDGTAKLWDLVTDRDSPRPLCETSEVIDLDFSPDSRRIVTGLDGSSGHATAHLWDSLTGKRLNPRLPVNTTIEWSLFSSNGAFVLLAGTAGAYLFNATNGQQIAKVTHTRSLTAAGFSPDGRFFFTSSRDGTTKVWNSTSGESIGPPLLTQEPVRAASFSPDGRRLVTAAGKAVIWDISLGTAALKPLDHRGVRFVCYSPDGRQVATTSSDHVVHLWDGESGQLVAAPMKHGGTVSGGAFSPDGHLFASFGASPRVRVWDTKSGSLALPYLTHPKSIQSVEFSRDGRLIATLSAGKSTSLARLWDAETGEPLTPPSGRFQDITRARLSPDGSRLAVASKDNGIWLWPIQSIDATPEDLQLLAWLQTSQQLSPARSLVPVAEETLRAAMQTQRTHHPQWFVRTPGQILAWHESQASEAELSGRWSSAAWHLTRLLDERPRDDGLLRRREEAYGHCRNWKAAEMDLETVLTNRTIFHESYWELTLLKLAQGDQSRYELVCSDFLRQFGATTNGHIANIIAWNCLLGPNTNIVRALALARKAVQIKPDAYHLVTLALGFIRAGNFEEAQKQLQLGRSKGGQDAYYDLFDAISRFRLGRKEEALNYLQDAVRKIDRLTDPEAEPGRWQDRLEFGLLRQEVESLLGLTRTSDTRSISPP